MKKMFNRPEGEADEDGDKDKDKEKGQTQTEGGEEGTKEDSDK